MKNSALIFLLLLVPPAEKSSANPNNGPKSRSVASVSSFRSAYGGAVIFAGDDVIITENSGYSNPGMVHIIRRSDAGQWEETQILKALAPFPGDGFGSAVAADENTLFVARFSSSESAGSIYVFDRDDSGQWNQTQIIETDGAASGDLFGTSMVVLGSHAVVSTPGADGGKGVLQTYMKSGGTWSGLERLQPDDLEINAAFGSSISFAKTKGGDMDPRKRTLPGPGSL